MPLLVGFSPEELTATTAILRLSATFSSSTSSSLVVTLFGLPIFLIFFAIVAALQVFYLNRLVLTREQVVTEQKKEELEPVTS